MERLLIFAMLIVLYSSCRENKPAEANHANAASTIVSASAAPSPHLTFRPINFGECKWTDGFWADRFKRCEEVMVPYMGELLCGDTGHALNNFKIAAGLMEGEHQGMRWHDGDFYKWLEAATYVYAQNGDKDLLREIDGYIAIIAQAQRADGYLQTQAQVRDDIDPYTNRRNHEMYNSGHLFTAACIHHRITGQTNFLDIALKQAELLYEIFYPESEQYGRFGFNQTQIIGLVDLYRTTGEEKYLQLAERFINRRGKYPVEHDESTEAYPIGDMVQERTPLREADEAVGHAVLALYYYAGAADVYAETGEQALIDALDRLWANVTEKKMYVTGAVGQAHYGMSTNRDPIHEGFIDEFMLPNLTAYNETCANVCNAMFSYRMLGVHGESKYADVMELVLYNSALSGIGLSGKDYFYANPLRMIHHARDFSGNKDATELSERAPYLPCFCCPPNLVRTIAQLSHWAYSLTANGLTVNLYGGNQLATQLQDGSSLVLGQETNYPWEGHVLLTVEECKAGPFEILLRIPGWAESATLNVNGEPVDGEIVAGTFARVERAWKSGDVIELELPMPVELIEGHARVEEVRNQVALKRGPVVYCLESPDLPHDTDIVDVYLPYGAERTAHFQDDLLGGVTAIETEVHIRRKTQQQLYQELDPPVWEPFATRFVPYYSWANRGTAEMTVWVPVIWN